jgi:hypothetical protein
MIEVGILALLNIAFVTAAVLAGEAAIRRNERTRRERVMDATEYLEVLRSIYGPGVWVARASDGRCTCGDGRGAFGVGKDWPQAGLALRLARARRKDSLLTPHQKLSW